MKKLIKKFNEKYGQSYGIIDDTLNNTSIYLSYRIIKALCSKDLDLLPYIKTVKLPKPSTPIETMLYVDCLKENRVSWNDLLDAPFGTTHQNIKFSFTVTNFDEEDNILSIGNSNYYLLTDKKYEVFEEPSTTEIYVDGKKLDVPLKVETYCIVPTDLGLGIDLDIIYGSYYSYSCGYEMNTTHTCEIISYHTEEIENEITSEFLNAQAILDALREDGGIIPPENLDLSELNNSIANINNNMSDLSDTIEIVDADLQNYKTSVEEILEGDYASKSSVTDLEGRVSENEGDILILQNTVNELPTTEDVADMIAEEIAGDSSALDKYALKKDLALVATSGDYNELKNTPHVTPEATIQEYDQNILDQAKAYVDEQLDGLADILDQIEGGTTDTGGGTGE